MKFVLLTAFSLSLLAPFAMSQEEEPKHLRFLALGQLPTWKEELIDGIRQGQKPPPGTMPPSPLSLVSGDSVIPFELNLRTFSDIMTMKGATEGLGIRNGETPESPLLLKAAKPAAPLSLGVIFADPATMLWDKPKMLLLRDDADSFPIGNIRLVNVSDKVVIVQLGGERSRPFGIAAGKSSIKQLQPGVNLIKVGYQTANGGQKQIWENQIRILPNQRVQCFFYKAVPQPGKDAVKFHYNTEPLPSLPRAARR